MLVIPLLLSLLFITKGTLVDTEAGRIVEQATIKPFFAQPLHPYSRGLLGARVDVDTDEHYLSDRLTEIPGSVGSAAGEKGCSFAPRCPIVVPGCRHAPPPLPATAT